MPRHDPINDFFNELLDATLTTVLDTMRPEFRKLAKSAVETARAKADAKATTTKTKRKNSNVTRRVTPPQLTLYDVLEVSPRASHETIEAAYKSLARRHHPDVGGSVSKMQDITNAYGVLKDKVARHKYDMNIIL
jgi:DnaJ-class molecular chaperone